ncbi:MAG: hypothetical protein JWL98_313 [Xanthomonadaceae bacterium]|nr:hypothetical protein [Xanthomonadaceae bacterium]
MTNNPYRNVGSHQFWRTAVTGVERFRYDPVTATRFTISPGDRIATGGSCFAQHISNRLSKIGFNYFITEAGCHLSVDQRRPKGYGVFSCRYGNIYTSRQLLQLFQECFEGREHAEAAWLRADGRYVDALRPQIDPDGFASIQAVRDERRVHLDAVRRMFTECDVFVFTLGLTETWRSLADGTVYPLAPGVSGGSFDESLHAFVNLDIHDVLSDLNTFLAGLKRVNPSVRVLLTVSPVPLIATYENRNVLVATSYSKSVLRVAADMAYRTFDWVDYFPSYEIITGSYTNSVYYEDDYRGIRDTGVDHVMRCFLRHYANIGAIPALPAGLEQNAGGANDIVCDEEAIDQVRI